MILHALHLTINDSDLTANLPKAFEQVKQIKDPELRFEQNSVVFAGKFLAGPLPVPFQAHCELKTADDGETLVVRLSKVKAAFFSGGGEAIVSAIKQQMPAIDGVKAEGDSFYIRVTAIASQRGFGVTGKIKEIAVTPGKLTLNIG